MDDKNKYNNALEKLQEALAPKDGREISGLTRGCIEEIFPELKESEDERIRKEIIEYIKTGTYHKDWIAWLEKQNKQKTDIPKWKYKKDNAPLSKDCLILNRYGCVVKAVSGAMVSDAWVLDYDELVKLPKEEVEKQDNQKPQGKSALEAANEEKVDNANKSVSDFKASDYYVSKVDGKIHNIHNFNELKKVEQNPAWSEEDERLCSCLIEEQEKALNNVKNDKYGHTEIISDLKEMYNERIDWLKSLKDRVKPQLDIINKAAEWWLIHDSYSKDTNNLVNDFKKDLLKYVNISE